MEYWAFSFLHPSCKPRAKVVGYLFAPKKQLKQPVILAKELFKILDNKELRERLGDTARKFIVNEWGNFNHYTECLYKVLTGKEVIE